MKYFFLATAFFSLGYTIPSFAPVFQLIAAGVIILILAVVLYFYVDTMAYSRITG